MHRNPAVIIYKDIFYSFIDQNVMCVTILLKSNQVYEQT